MRHAQWRDPSARTDTSRAKGRPCSRRLPTDRGPLVPMSAPPPSVMRPTRCRPRLSPRGRRARRGHTGTEILALPLSPASLRALPHCRPLPPIDLRVLHDRLQVPCVLFGDELETHITRPTPRHRRSALPVRPNLVIPQLRVHQAHVAGRSSTERCVREKAPLSPCCARCLRKQRAGGADGGIEAIRARS
jgi:hypothetical protein